MKKIVLNISETTFEKLRFEAIKSQKSVADVIKIRLLERPFDAEIEEAYDALVYQEFREITLEE